VVIGYSNRGGGKKVKYSKTTFALVYQGWYARESNCGSSIHTKKILIYITFEILLFQLKQYFTQGDFAQMAKGLTMAG
jgi:hypothetical protein